MSVCRHAVLNTLAGQRLAFGRGLAWHTARRYVPPRAKTTGESPAKKNLVYDRKAYGPKGELKGKAVPEGPFQELGLKEISDKVGGIRVRQHVNPLKRELQIVTPPPAWNDLFEDPNKALHVDIGCGPGRFLLMKARERLDQNHLGLDIRVKLTERANAWAAEVGCESNVHFMMSNGTVSFSNILSAYPGQVACVSVQFPDPHFKKRHHKRRIVQPQLVHAIADCIQTGTKVFLQSDVLDVAEAMRDQFEKYSVGRFAVDASLHRPEAVTFADEHIATISIDDTDEDGSDEDVEETEEDVAFQSDWASFGWLKENPMCVPTEREVYVLNDGLPVYRIMLVRC